VLRPAAVVDPSFGPRMRRLRLDQGLSYRRLARAVHFSHGYLHGIENGKTTPTREVAERIDAALHGGGTLAALVTTASAPATGTPARSREAADAWSTMELLARLRADDVSPTTIEALHAAVFDLCCQYSWRDPHELRAEGHGWLREVTANLRKPVGLGAHRELLVASGWLGLLIGCVEYDMGMQAAAEATRIAAREVGQEAGHGEVVAWAWEMSAWFALTQRRYPDAVNAAKAGQAAIGEHPAAVQLIAQEAKARGRMGDRRGVRRALDRSRALLDTFPAPQRPDHHFVVDPGKWDFYAMDAYRLAREDELAAHHARQVLQLGQALDGTETVPMRMAEARLTLGAVAARAAELDEALREGMSAFRADRRSLPALLMVGAELDAELHQRYPHERATEEFHQALLAISRARPLPDDQ
jgi:transcriptional regulator with XRE-family HTH domain